MKHLTPRGGLALKDCPTVLCAFCIATDKRILSLLSPLIINFRLVEYYQIRLTAQ